MFGVFVKEDAEGGGEYCDDGDEFVKSDFAFGVDAENEHAQDGTVGIAGNAEDNADEGVVVVVGEDDDSE